MAAMSLLKTAETRRSASLASCVSEEDDGAIIGADADGRAPVDMDMAAEPFCPAPPPPPPPPMKTMEGLRGLCADMGPPRRWEIAQRKAGAAGRTKQQRATPTEPDTRLFCSFEFNDQ